MGQGASEQMMDPGVVRKAQGFLADTRMKLRGLNNNMDGDIVAVQADWRGSGGNAFRNANRTWVEYAERLNRALDKLEEGLGGTEKVMAQADDDQVQKANSAAGQIGESLNLGKLGI